MTKEQALALVETEWWKDLDAKSIAGFQLFEPRLCMPFGEFQEAVQKALGRPVWTHEFAFEALQDEFLGHRPRPTFAEIIELIPAEKRIVLLCEPHNSQNTP